MRRLGRIFWLALGYDFGPELYSTLRNSRRRARLAQRGQPELANLRMDNWAAYLRGQADALGLRVIDTDALAVEVVADLLAAQVKPDVQPTCL